MDFTQMKMAVLQKLSDEDLLALLAVLPRRKKYMMYVGWDPNSGLPQPKGCRAGKKCSRPHAVSADDPYGDINEEQLKYFKSPNITCGVNLLPYVRGHVARKRERNDNTGLSFKLMPPVQAALKVFSVCITFRT
jgi:hypothetical protein